MRPSILLLFASLGIFHAPAPAALRAELDAWMKAQGDGQPVLSKPRLLSDPTSYGPQAEITGSGKSASKQKAKK